MKLIKKNLIFISFVIFIFVAQFLNKTEQGYSNEEVIGSYIIIGILMALFAFLSYYYSLAIKTFFNKFLGDDTAFTLSWIVPLIIFFLIPILLTEKVLENYSLYFPLFFN